MPVFGVVFVFSALLALTAVVALEAVHYIHKLVSHANAFRRGTVDTQLNLIYAAPWQHCAEGAKWTAFTRLDYNNNRIQCLSCEPLQSLMSIQTYLTFFCESWNVMFLICIHFYSLTLEPQYVESIVTTLLCALYWYNHRYMPHFRH